MERILEFGFKWSFSRHMNIRLKILSPFEDKNLSDQKFKEMLQNVYHEAKNELASTQFDLDNYINEALESLSELKLKQIFVKLLRGIPNQEQENLPLKLWEKIEGNITNILYE